MIPVSGGRNDEAAAKSLPGADVFKPAPLRSLRIEVVGAALEQLKKDKRQYTRATFREGDTVITNAGVHLKGAAGSFRELDDRPALTVNFDKFVPGQRWHGLQKIHLNNSVQDDSLLTENLCGELFREAGVPAPRASNARVELNGRDLGIYVIVEGFDKTFLKQYYRSHDGHLYDGGFCQDITQPLERLGGSASKEQPELAALAAAAQEPDLARRWEKLQQLLNMERFITFCALEVMMWDWDGYVMKPNNYKLYWDPESKKTDFFPHGMDQMFGEPNGPVLPAFNGLVAQAVIQIPEARRRYLERMAELLTNVFKVEAITSRLSAYAAPIRSSLAERNPDAAREYDGQVQRLRDLIAQRAVSLAQQLSLPPPDLLKFANGAAKVGGWSIQNEPAVAKLEQGTGPDGKNTLSISTGADTTASWRAKVLLPGGRFRFEALARTAGVRPNLDEKGQGAGIRISGSPQPRTNHLAGDTPWQKLEYEFDVAPPGGEVVLVCELRAGQGQVWFALDSLRLVSKGSVPENGTGTAEVAR